MSKYKDGSTKMLVRRIQSKPDVNLTDNRFSMTTHTKSPNEASIQLVYDDLKPYLMVVKPSRPSLTYNRIE